MQIQYQSPGICVFQSALFQTTSTVIDTPDLVLIIDPNWLPEEVENIRHYVYNICKGRPLYLLFTHSDYDHIIAYNAFPGARCIASEAFVNNPDPEATLQQIRDFDDEYYIRRDYAIDYPVIDVIVKEDEQIFQLGDTKLQFWLAPGHNPDGIFTLVEPGNFFIAGDYLSNVEFPYIYHSSTAYESSLEKADQIIMYQIPELLIPGHGQVTDNPLDMHQRVLESEIYIQELRKHLQAGTEFPVGDLWEKYYFPKIMTKFHEENVALVLRELGL
ncbi:MAG: hypothetical protein DHS20C18_09790 [Saprospiraceae bacterium]|nr:MAG: hypothetical protein DHS20C18_09790 [Saprospiraceae bacterium]